MIVSWLIMSVMYIVAIRCFFLKRSGMTDSSKFLYPLCFLSLGLSLVQYENWLWALQLDFFLTQAFVILAMIFIGVDALGIGTRSLLLALCAAGASLCSGQGMLLWLSNALCAIEKPQLVEALCLCQARQIGLRVFHCELAANL
jgi:hypothetical protein